MGIHESKVIIFSVGSVAQEPIILADETSIREHLLPIDVRVRMNLDVGLQWLEFLFRGQVDSEKKLPSASRFACP